MRTTHWFVLSCFLGAATLAALPANAKKKQNDDTPSDTSSPSSAATSPSSDTTADTHASVTAEEPHKNKKHSADPLYSDDPDSGYEKPGQSYDFVGLRYRHTILPGFMLNLFVAGGPGSVSIPTFGPEYTHRKDNFDTTFALTWSGYGMDVFPFKGKNESDDAWERVKSDLWMLNATVDFVWSAPIDRNIAFTYGLTTGLSLVFGDLRRVQAKNAGADPCSKSEEGTRSECGTNNDHYPAAGANANDVNTWYKEKDWFSGGQRPNLYAVFGPIIGMRFKPMKQLVMRVDGGFNLFSGFFFGVGADYGL